MNYVKALQTKFAGLNVMPIEVTLPYADIILTVTSCKLVILPTKVKRNIIAKGRLANLVLSEGHPSEVMDMSFGLQALMSEYIVKNKDALKPGMVEVPVDIDDRVGLLKLEAMGIEIDTLTEEQYNYIHGYDEGT